jgi:hypothetical protein
MSQYLLAYFFTVFMPRREPLEDGVTRATIVRAALGLSLKGSPLCVH